MKQLNVENGIVNYRIEREKAVVTGFQGYAANLVLPSQIEGYPVAVIDRKAFLSRKSLCRILLPDCVEEVGDWAFAHCDSLAEVSFPRREVRFGRAAFKDCRSLKRIVVRDSARECRTEQGESGSGACRKQDEMKPGEREKRGCGTDSLSRESAFGAELLAAAVTMLDANYLLNLSEAGSREWLEQWDIRLLSVLRASDSDGYISQSVYGEEDYIGTDLEEFTNARRKAKVRLAFLRLLHPQGLSQSLKGELEQYLRSLTKGQATEETWQVIREEHGSHREYYALFAELGCIRQDNFDGILGDIGENSPEMKAFFLKYMGERRKETGDFFESLEL